VFIFFKFDVLSQVNKTADPFDDLFLCERVLLSISYWTSGLNPKCLSQLLHPSARNWCILRLFFCDWGGFADSIGDMARVIPSYFRVFEMVSSPIFFFSLDS
jgi:hypothetical protein